MYVSTLDILFRQISMLIKVRVAFGFGLQPDTLINRLYTNLSIKGPEVQKQQPHELL